MLVALIATGLTARSLMLGVSDTLTVVSDVLAIALIASFIVVARAAHRARNAEARARVSLAVQDTRLTSIVTNLPGVAYRCRPRGPGFVYVSPAILDLTGIPAVEFMEPTRRFDDLVHPDDLPRVAASIGRAAASGTAYRLQYRLVLADGTLIHVRDTGGVTRDPFDETTWIDGWLFDITEEVDNAERLQAAVAAAEHANRTKSSFLAAMSHELRTPLNAIIGFTKVVRKTGSGTLAARELNYLDRVANNGEHLLGLINDLLDLAKIEAGRMEFRREWVAPAPLLREVIASLEAQALLRGLTLTLEAAAPAGEIELDATRLRQVLINLIGNAIKFTERGGVTVHLEVADGRTCAIHVVDTGI
ncbi:MAG: PAS domain-containing protein, partial [Gemmatimonadaceae bacterium]|nr:PAS domain-containing protein [Gemmatimonadaceae bacterium]